MCKVAKLNFFLGGGIEPRALCLLAKHADTELHPKALKLGIY